MATPNPKKNACYKKLLPLSLKVNRYKALLDFYNNNNLKELARILVNKNKNMKVIEKRLRKRRKLYLKKVEKDLERAKKRIAIGEELKVKRLVIEKCLSKQKKCRHPHYGRFHLMDDGKEFMSFEDLVGRELRNEAHDFILSHNVTRIKCSLKKWLQYLEKVHYLCRNL